MLSRLSLIGKVSHQKVMDLLFNTVAVGDCSAIEGFYKQFIFVGLLFLVGDARKPFKQAIKEM